MPVDEEEYEETAKRNVAQAALDVFVGACALIARTFGSIDLLALPVPTDGVPDAKALTAACIVRFIALPRRACSDCFPSRVELAVVPERSIRGVGTPHHVVHAAAAQNLVLLTRLREATRPLAPRLAALMLRQYVFAIIPVTFWLTAFTDAVV